MSRIASVVVCFIILFSFYAFHTAPGVTVEDSGDFQMAAQTLGIAHPPGYPLYTMVAFVASKVPFVSPAYSVNLLSAFFGALSLVFFWLILSRVFDVTLAWTSGIATASVGVHPIFWSQSGVAEVYTLNASLILWVYGVALDALGAKVQKHKVLLIGFGMGLGLSHHYPLFILAVFPLVAWSVWTASRQLRSRKVLKALMCGLVLGLTPYLYLIIQALWGNPDYNFGKLSTLQMVWDHILRFHYRGIDDVGGSLSDKFSIFYNTELDVLKGFALLAPLVLIGVWRFEVEKWKWRWILHGSILATTLALALSLGFIDNDRYRAIFRAYMAPALFFHAVYLARGLQTLASWASDRQWGQSALIYASRSIMILALFIQAAWAYPMASHRQDQFVSLWARSLLESLAPNSSLILCGTDVLAVYYTQLVEGVRPDVALYDQFSLFTQKNLYGSKLLFQTEDPLFVRKNFELQHAKNASSAVYYLCEESIKELAVPYMRTPYAFKVTSQGRSASPQLTKVEKDLWDAAVYGLPQDEYWLNKRRSNFFYHSVAYAADFQKELLAPTMGYTTQSSLIRSHELVLALAKVLSDRQEYDLTLQLLQGKEGRFGRQQLHAEELSLYCGLELLQGNDLEAETLCLLALEQKDAENCLGPAHVNLALIYRKQGNQEKVKLHANQALQCNPDDRRAKSLLSQ